MPKDKILAPDVDHVFAEHLSLPKTFVRGVIKAMKAADRIAAARPVSPPITPRAIAKVLLALTAPSIRKAVETERALGTLRYLAGDGQLNPEDEINDVIEASVGWRYRDDLDMRDGAIVVAHDDNLMTVGGSTFGSKKDQKAGGLSRYTKIKFSAIAGIARALLPEVPNNA